MLETESLRTALAHLNQAAKKVLFLTDAAGHLTAALTDGDVRRHLLSGGTLEDSAANAGNHRPITATGREEAIRLLAQHGCIAVPVLDGAGRIMDIVLEDLDFPHEWEELLENSGADTMGDLVDYLCYCSQNNISLAISPEDEEKLYATLIDVCYENMSYDRQVDFWRHVLETNSLVCEVKE